VELTPVQLDVAWGQSLKLNVVAEGVETDVSSSYPCQQFQLIVAARVERNFR
jgi:hypothetical protein